MASSSRNPFSLMSSSYSEITEDAMCQNYEKMDVGEDLIDEDEKQRPDSLYYDNMECKSMPKVINY